MSWKKNVFSCLMWAVYLFLVVAAMILISRVICDSFGVAACFEYIMPAAYLLVTGAIVFGLHRMAVGLNVGFLHRGRRLVWLEGALVFILFAAGLYLRAAKLCSEEFVLPDESVYLKLAYVSADKERIPQFSHGAVYLYLWLLRLCFMLLGNKAAAALWLQAVLQMLGVLLSYFAVRKMAGRISAVMMAAFFLLSPYLVEKVTVPSPEILYLLIFAFVLLFISQGVQYVFGVFFWLAAGAMAAVSGYLDVSGLLLLPVMLGVIVMRRPEAERKVAQGIAGCLAGFFLGAAVCFLADALSSGKAVSGIVRAWAELYRWGDLQLSITISGFDVVWLITLILCFMAWGIYGFWCSRGVERFTVWIFCLCSAVLMQCLGMFTEEMSGFGLVFFFGTVLAGLGIRESMALYPAGNGRQHPNEPDRDGIFIEDFEEIVVQDGLAEDSVQAAEEKGQITGKEKETVQNREERTDSLEKKDMDEERAAGTVPEEGNERAGSLPEEEPVVEFLENPLPLPKKHEKRVMDYRLDPDKEHDGYDIDVADDDDFDH